jgi:Ca2+-binding EF-hand superfamily protein
MFRSIIQQRQKSRYSARDTNRAQKSKLTREERLALVAQKDSDKLLFSEFLKAVLDFQLKEHEKFLYKFIVAFKQVDNDNNGVLNEDEFVNLIKSMRICDSEEEISKFLEVVDPYNNQEVTFSEIVHLFSAHMVSAEDPNNPDKEIPILEKFAKDETFELDR